MLTIQQKAQCVLWYHELKSPIAVQRKFRSEFGEDPPHTNSIKRWFKKFMETGSINLETWMAKDRVGQALMKRLLMLCV